MSLYKKTIKFSDGIGYRTQSEAPCCHTQCYTKHLNLLYEQARLLHLQPIKNAGIYIKNLKGVDLHF